jgi:SSS family solute:Na+ symporter/sodium/pantothenate symporter
VSGFIIGAALVCQPHILTKALYVKSDRAVRRYLFVAVIALTIFFLLPFAGFYARLTVSPEQLVDASTGLFRQDLVMTVYLKTAFPGWLFTTMSVVLLAAGMSTLDGILVALSTISANDLLLNLLDRFGTHRLSAEKRLSLAYKLSHFVLIAIAAAAFLICLNPPKLLGIFGQVGVYGMAVAAVPPLLTGVLFREIPLKLVWGTSLLGLSTHFLLYFFGAKLFPQSNLAFANPGLTATLAITVSLVPAIFGAWLFERQAVRKMASLQLEE